MRIALRAVVLSIILSCAAKQLPEPEPTASPSSPGASSPAAGAATAAAPASRAADLQVDLTPLYFGFDSAELTSVARERLGALADVLRSRPGGLLIEGHCDDRGTVEYNMALGERRAAAARQYLIRLGIAAGRLTTISYGENRPATPGEDEEAWARNRRNELVPTGELATR